MNPWLETWLRWVEDVHLLLVSGIESEDVRAFRAGIEQRRRRKSA